MAIYVCQHDLKSSYGVLVKGSEYDLTPEEAATFNRDSPGVLVLKPAKKSTSSGSTKTKGTIKTRK